MIRSAWLALSLLAAAPPAASDAVAGARQDELAELLVQDCGSCHGLRMKGGLGPALLPARLQGKSAEYLSTIILNGRPGSAMPAWKDLLSPAEARWIAERLLRPESP